MCSSDLINFYLNVDCLEKLTLLTNTNTADIFTFLHLTIWIYLQKLLTLTLTKIPIALILFTLLTPLKHTDSNIAFKTLLTILALQLHYSTKYYGERKRSTLNTSLLHRFQICLAWCNYYLSMLMCNIEWSCLY